MVDQNPEERWSFRARTIQEQVAEQLKQMILNGDLRMGQRLTEKDLAQRLGVSRVPVREALQQLAQEGLLDHIPRIGRVVHVPSAEQIQEIQEVRGVLEGLAARKLAERSAEGPDLGWLKELENFNREMRLRFSEGDLHTYFATSRSFHVAMVDATGNESLKRVHSFIMNRAALFRYITGGMAERQTQALQEHDGILKAICRGEADSAEQMMREHHATGMRAMLKALEARQDQVTHTPQIVNGEGQNE